MPGKSGEFSICKIAAEKTGPNCGYSKRAVQSSVLCGKHFRLGFQAIPPICEQIPDTQSSESIFHIPT
ncbi:hypothetical protein AB0L82_00625 [Nocardia sp. NPDC052001]|uniref:hypothetical protein n=1 Tax=Nocardia sp. NPDC052001 TaxID=3154853 RepID=UPI00342BC445